MPMYETILEPIAKVGENIRLDPDKRYFKVNSIEPIPEIEIDFGPLDPGATKQISSRDEKMQLLQMRAGYLGQYRMKILAPVKIKIYRPDQNVWYQTKHTVAVITPDSPEHLTEFYVYQDSVPRFDIINMTNVKLNKVKIKFYGFMYELVELTETPEKYTVVNLFSPIKPGV